MAVKTVLGIESSCDDTAVAIVDEKKNIIENIVTSKLDEHRFFGGVVPEIASRNHLLILPSIIEAIKQYFPNLDAIAVTAGPGLIGGVLVGLMFAKGLAYALNKPIVPINHLEGHLLTVRLISDIQFPYLALLISGGHCQFVLVRGCDYYEILGSTLDDAVGEAFDKVGKMLGLDYPAGAVIEKLALRGDSERFDIPMPLIYQDNCDMSFSGIKTAVSRLIAKLKADNQFDEQVIFDICASFQKAIATILGKKLENAIKRAGSIKGIAICGGVAANMALKSAFAQIACKYNIALHVPTPELCTDNAAMIAWAGIEKSNTWLHATEQIIPRANWPIA